MFVLAKYFHHIVKMDDASIKNELIQFFDIAKHTIDNQMRFRKMIDGAIKGSKKQFLKVCREIRITENEIAKINMLKDTTTRKIAFVLLCMWKANGNKPFRTTFSQAANEIGLNTNGKKLRNVHTDLMWKEKYTYIYNRNAERRKGILEKMIEIDSQYGQLFIPYDAFKYQQHVLRPTRKSAIAIWRYEQDYYETPELKLPSYYEKMSVEEKEEYKSNRYKFIKDEYYGEVLYDEFFESVDLAYIKDNIDVISRCYMKDDFARIIGGDVFYTETGAHDKIKVLFADIECDDGILINVNNLPQEYEALFGENRSVIGRCVECGNLIIKNSNKTKYCEECKVKVRKEKVRINMQNLRKRNKELA